MIFVFFKPFREIEKCFRPFQTVESSEIIKFNVKNKIFVKQGKILGNLLFLFKISNIERELFG